VVKSSSVSIFWRGWT